jgi:hypothetical protein
MDTRAFTTANIQTALALLNRAEKEGITTVKALQRALSMEVAPAGNSFVGHGMSIEVCLDCGAPMKHPVKVDGLLLCGCSRCGKSVIL